MDAEHKHQDAEAKLKRGFELARGRSRIQSAVVWIADNDEGGICLRWHGDKSVIELLEVSVRQSQRYQLLHLIRYRVRFHQWVNRMVLRLAWWRPAQ